MAGYSGTPLVKKLGIKPDHAIVVRNCPMDYRDLVPNIPETVSIGKHWRKGLDFTHIFSKKRKELESSIAQALKYISPNGMIWVSWPKKASRIETDITEDTIREIIRGTDLVDVKVCAVDEVWSGLKLVIRKEKRSH
ncbi:MAG: DUF3052 family protein [Leptospiraceae bacterium]|nr:DUF3052 family protein [Leptospiraceae bacterium]